VARVDYYYAEPNWVGVQYVNGKEAESDGAGGLLVSDVEGAAVLGRHALTSDWSLVWALTWHEQGELYQRAGFDVGLARRF
jgi:YaiO family outer membrane protein